MIRITTAAVGVLLMALSIGCKAADSKSEGAAVTDSKQADTAVANAMDMKGMANMPGMKDASSGTGGSADSGKARISKEITLTAAQIEHGSVKWAPAVMGTAAGSALIPGVIVPNEDRTARLGAPASGRVVKVLVRPGDNVRVDQSLVTIQSPAAGMAQAEVSKAAAGLSAARAEAQYAATARARAERLLALKAIPKQEYERAITDDEQARATLAQAEAEAQRARTTADQLSAGSGAPGEIVVRAPLAGVVLERTAVPGAVIDAGAPLVIITDPSSLWLAIDAPESMTSLFQRGQLLRFTVAAYPGDTLSAITEAVGAGLDVATRTLTVRALISNSSRRLKPEMLTNVIVNGGAKVPAVLLPEDAVQSLEGQPQVFIVRPDPKGGVQILRRDVTTGARAGGKIAVTHGLLNGDLVVTGGAFAVKAQFQKAAMAKMVM